jgi:hypothetical protein
MFCPSKKTELVVGGYCNAPTSLLAPPYSLLLLSPHSFWRFAVTTMDIVAFMWRCGILENAGVVQTGICYSSRTWQLNEGHNGALSGDMIQKKDKLR